MAPHLPIAVHNHRNIAWLPNEEKEDITVFHGQQYPELPDVIIALRVFKDFKVNQTYRTKLKFYLMPSKRIQYLGTYS